MFQRKVYPGTSDDRDEMLTVDDVVESVDKEMAKISSEVEAFSNSISSQSNQNNRNSNNRQQQPLRQQQQQSYQEEDDEVEEIRLSHEIYNSEEKVTEELEVRFKALKQHVEEYRNLYRASADKLRGSEAKVSELESKVDTLEEERIRLEEQVKANVNNNNNPNNQFLTMVNRTNVNGQLSSVDAQRRAEELRKALLFDDDDNNLAIDFESLLQSKNVFAAIMEYLSLFDPFKRDISTIHARFGSSVASYFIFSRYL